ncbi:BBSome-interacting protein 1 [Crotalus adamanteus]|uniref:BBSome-interacting protein 1 n=1 Tax=Crotalus adamanteus TaxID=8729 RepID=A0AAW1BFV9_CROAD
MSESKFREVLPKHGMLAIEDVTTMVMCKPKLLPLKSVTLEKLEKMQREAQEIIQQQEQATQQCSTSALDQ